MGRSRSQSGQVMVLVALALLALIGSAALVLMAGSVEWQKNQLQQLADQAALDSAMKIGVGCDAAKAAMVITEADNFLATQRTRTGVLSIAAGTCAVPYTGTDTFAGGLSATIHYPYQAHQQQVELILTLNLPISFGAELGKSGTSVVRRAVAQALPGSTSAISATTITCAGGQVNVGGSVFAQNVIARVGTCALYAHARLDVASGTYSDLGNVSVYAAGQTWTAPGICRAALLTGSASAICSDGFELTGHIAPACATNATSYLSPGDRAVNANPCAAGTGPQPVAPRAANRAPEPNLDPVAVATLQGTGGAACTAAGVYPNIVVGGVVVGTGRGPAPIRDANGYYHFKPSCYGYLNVSALRGGISNVQIGPKSAVTSPLVTPTLPVASQAGTLLVADIRSGPSGVAFTAPAGWVRANSRNQAGASRTEIWYYPNNPGGIVSAAFGVPNPGIAQVSEWRNVIAAAPLDRTGTLGVNANQASVTISTAGATTQANELVITDMGPGVQAPQVYTPGAGWTSLVRDMPNGFAAEYRLDLPAAVASETVTVTKATRWSGVIATFRGGGAAVLDPGFYYFNGSGFAGGGGICLNGGIMLARDVTLEFVNQAGLSSGTCAVGGGANCVGACQLGSAPCSLQACPPNVPADSPSNLTWLAAPCSSAPSPLDATSCPGSAWCPAGDRSCSNLLVWGAPASTGQIALKGDVVKAWLLGSTEWPGTCTYKANGTASIAGSLACGTLTISAAVGAGTAVGSDAGVSTATVEAILVE
jgi:hypothetical protein